jgi:hypothetical protein
MSVFVKMLIFLLFLSLFPACQNSDTVTVKSRESHREFRLPQIQRTDTLTQEFDRVENDTILHFFLLKDSAYLKKGTTVIAKQFIQPKVIIGGDEPNPKEVEDQAFFMANCMVLLKNIKTAGHFCHTPEVGAVRIFTSQGNTTLLEKGKRTSECPEGFDLTSCFQGNRFSSPDGKWGLITNEAEGQLAGFLIVYYDGSIREVCLGDKIFLTGETQEATFNKKMELTWPNFELDGNPITFTVNSFGQYRVGKK